MLEEDLGPARGLRGLDRALKARTDGLYDLYPQFVADRLLEPSFFRDVPRTDIRLGPEPVVKTVEGRVPPVAAAPEGGRRGSR